MRRWLILLALAAVLPLAPAFADDDSGNVGDAPVAEGDGADDIETSDSQGSKDDFGVWMAVGLQKQLPRNLTVGVDGEWRTRDNSKKVDRLSIGFNVNYKVNKYLRLGVAYSFLDSFKDGGVKVKYRDEEGLVINNIKYTHDYWRPQHRVYVDISPTIKVLGMLRLTLRERYQYSHVKGVTVARDKYDLKKKTHYWNDEETDYTYSYHKWEYEDDPKEKPAKDTHMLRSRLKLELDKKKVPWSPFVSVETMNYFKHLYLSKVRTVAGTEYKFNKRNSVGIAYVMTYDREDKERFHALNLSYDIKF